MNLPHGLCVPTQQSRREQKMTDLRVPIDNPRPDADAFARVSNDSDLTEPIRIVRQRSIAGGLPTIASIAVDARHGFGHVTGARSALVVADAASRGWGLELRRQACWCGWSRLRLGNSGRGATSGPAAHT